MSDSAHRKAELLGRLRAQQLVQADDEVASSAMLEPLFASWRTMVRRRLLCRHVLDGLTVGVLFGCFVSAIGLWSSWPLLRWAGLVAAALGALVGGWLSWRARWDDGRVAMFVDGVLQTPELITTAVNLGAQAPAAVQAEAIAALRSTHKGPPGLRRHHGLGLLGACAVVALLAWPSRAPAQAAPGPGLDTVKLVTAPGLDRVAGVERLPARDTAQKQRLLDMAQEARELRRKLHEGMPRREALDRIGHLKRQLDAERRSFVRGENALGLSAAASALRSAGLPGLADALEAGDMQAVDEMMERLANDREMKDRERAREALEEALEAAKKQKADDLARALERQKRRFDERSGRADVLRELADALRGTPQDPGSRSFDQRGTDAEARELADALRKGLEKLTPEERKRLAERLRERAEADQGQGRSSPRSKERQRELQRDLSTPEGQRRLEERLRELANERPRGEQEQLDQGLGDAETGADETDDAIGGRAQIPGQDGSKGHGAGQRNGRPGRDGTDESRSDGRGDGSAGSGGAESSHAGKSKRVDADTLKARAHGKRDPRGPELPAGGRTSSAGIDGAKATVGATGDLTGTAAGELRGVDRAEIPEPIRRQVKSYFE